MPREKQIQTERESNQSCGAVLVLKRCACGCHPENSDGDEKKHRAHQLLSGKKVSGGAGFLFSTFDGDTRPQYM